MLLASVIESISGLSHPRRVYII